MGVERGPRHRRGASFGIQPVAQDFSTSDDRTSFRPEAPSQASLQAQQRNALSGPHAVGKRQEPQPSSPLVELTRQQPQPFVPAALPAPGEWLPPTVVPLRQHYRPEESPEDISSLADLNPSLVTLVPDFSFSAQKPAKEKPKRKASREAAAAERKQTPQTAAVATADVAKAADAVPSPARQGARRPEVSAREANPSRGSRSASKTPLAEGQGMLSVKEADVLPSECGDCGKIGVTASAPHSGEGGVDVIIGVPASGGGSKKRGPARPRSSLRPREMKLQPLPFQNVFGMSVDEMLDSAPASREQRTTDMARLSSSPAQARRHLDAARQPSKRTPLAQESCEQATETAGSAQVDRAMREVAVELDASSAEKASRKPLPALKNPALRALTIEDRTSTFGSGAFVVEDFLANLHTDQGIF